MIDYSKKLTTTRKLYEIENIDMSIESDRGRILSSPSFRRLQKRTQVFALELNASIRTRLTHSLEVAQTARYISKTILSKLKEEGLDKYGLVELENAFISTSEMTSLLHDIGNPPFGHFAEQTINQWIKQNAIPILNSFKDSLKETKDLKEIISKDITNYDGNAQAIRIITKLQRLNLSYTQILSVLKYTRGAYEEKDQEGCLDYLRKKPGFYYSEKNFIKEIQSKLEVKHSHRFPITYIMEAADDISYLTSDLQDAVKKGILNLDQVYDLIKHECNEDNETYLLELIEDRYKKAKKDQKPYQFSMFFTLFRAAIVNDLVGYVSDIYLNNHEDIFKGKFNSSLLDYDKDSRYYKAIKVLERISKKYIYQNIDVEKMELQGYSIVNGLLNAYKPLLKLTSNDFENLLQDKKIDCFISMRLIRRISSKQIVAYQNDVETIDRGSSEEYQIMEWYYRVRLIIDYISGMTDDFALHEYQILTSIK